MDNDEIKQIFIGIKEDTYELKSKFKEYVIEGKKEHKEIKDTLRKLCDRMKDAENTIDNHLINSIQKDKTKREKTFLLIAVIGSIIGVVSVVHRII